MAMTLHINKKYTYMVFSVMKMNYVIFNNNISLHLYIESYKNVDGSTIQVHYAHILTSNFNK